MSCNYTKVVNEGSKELVNILAYGNAFGTDKLPLSHYYTCVKQLKSGDTIVMFLPPGGTSLFKPQLETLLWDYILELLM